MDKDIEKEMIKLMKETPDKFLMYMFLLSGRECVKSNAGELKLNMDCDIEEKRYDIQVSITVNPQ